MNEKGSAHYFLLIFILLIAIAITLFTITNKSHKNDTDYDVIENIEPTEEQSAKQETIKLTTINNVEGSISKKILSPDKSKSALLVDAGFSSYFLVYKDNKNDSYKEVDFAEEVVWSKNSRYIAYSGKVADAGSTYKLNIFDTNTKEVIDLRDKLNEDEVPFAHISFHNIRWEQDDKFIQVDWTAYSDIPYGEILDEGTTDIHLEE